MIKCEAAFSCKHRPFCTESGCAGCAFVSATKKFYFSLKETNHQDIKKKYFDFAIHLNSLDFSDAVSIYKIDSRSGKMVLLAHVGKPIDADIALSVTLIDHERQIPIRSTRGNLIGLISFSIALRGYPVRSAIMFVARMIAREFAIDALNDFIRFLSDPPALDTASEDYANALAKICCRSVQAAYSAIRVLSNNSLVVLGSYCEESQSPVSDHDRYDVNFDSSIFKHLTSIYNEGNIRTIVSRETRSGYHFNSPSDGANPELMSFVNTLFPHICTLIFVPITSAASDFCLLHIGYPYRRRTSENDEFRLLSLSKYVGLHLNRYERQHDYIMARDEAARNMALGTNYELIRGVLHSALGSVSSLHQAHNQLAYAVQAGKVSDLSSIVDSILESSRQSLNDLKKIKSLSEVLEKNFEKSSIKKTFEEAENLLRPLLTREGVSVRIEGGESIFVFMQAETMKYVFYNLLLNSLDAFRSLTRKSNRTILLKIEERAAENRVYLSFIDNATGLRLGPGSKIQRIEDIWVQGVTTKRGGSGYGLPMVRLVIQNIHGGSIDVTNIRNGMSFLVKLFTDPRKQQQ